MTLFIKVEENDDESKEEIRTAYPVPITPQQRRYLLEEVEVANCAGDLFRLQPGIVVETWEFDPQSGEHKEHRMYCHFVFVVMAMCEGRLLAEARPANWARTRGRVNGYALMSAQPLRLTNGGLFMEVPEARHLGLAYAGVLAALGYKLEG